MTECNHTVRLGERKGPSQHPGVRGILFASSPQPESLLGTCMQNKLYVPPLGWNYGNDVSVAGGRLRIHDPSFPPTGHPLQSGCCSLCCGSRCLTGWLWGMRRQVWFSFSTLPFPLSFVSLVSRQSTDEVKFSSSTP